ncbi:hypothetical protein CEXT_511421 [Caerostris extrusa]|uniref:Uncharacterized protein n=1 Tax=Caerostris extrusa TaxID=172846 RepID=A0AAV4Y9Y8_CAEEX|nr:hypothetical protein CEXT_511421 [Caerostris extrusa]
MPTMAALITDVHDIAETLSSLSLECSEETDNTMNISTNQKVQSISSKMEALRLAPILQNMSKEFLENLMVSGRLVIRKLEQAKINVENCFEELKIRLNIHNFPENIDSSPESVLMMTNSSEIEIWTKVQELLLQSKFDCIRVLLEVLNDLESFVRKFYD